MSIIDAVAGKLQCQPRQVFRFAALKLKKPANDGDIWFHAYERDGQINPRVVNFCLDILYPPKPQKLLGGAS